MSSWLSLSTEISREIPMFLEAKVYTDNIFLHLGMEKEDLAARKPPVAMNMQGDISY